MKKIVSIIVSIVLTVSIFTTASASANISSTFVGLISAVQAEKTADVGKRSAQKGGKEETPWEKEEVPWKKEEAQKKDDEQIIHREEVSPIIAGEKAEAKSEQKLREEVIIYAMKLFVEYFGVEKKLPATAKGFFERDVDKSIAFLRSEQTQYENEAQNSINKFKYICDCAFDGAHGIVIIFVLFFIMIVGLPLWLNAILSGVFALRCRALIEAKQHFKYRLNG